MELGAALIEKASEAFPQGGSEGNDPVAGAGSGFHPQEALGTSLLDEGEKIFLSQTVCLHLVQRGVKILRLFMVVLSEVEKKFPGRGLLAKGGEKGRRVERPFKIQLQSDEILEQIIPPQKAETGTAPREPAAGGCTLMIKVLIWCIKARWQI